MHEQLACYISSKISVNEEELRIILSYFKPMSVKRNEFLLTQGETSLRTYFISRGCLRLFFINEDGQAATRHFSFENQFATGLVSFITGEPSDEFIQAVEASEVGYITRKDFYHLLKVIPQWETFYRDYLERGYVNNTKRLMSFLVQDAAAKYRRLLNENPAIVRRLPNKMVASYLNISPETLSRLKTKA